MKFNTKIAAGILAGMSAATVTAGSVAFAQSASTHSSAGSSAPKFGFFKKHAPLTQEQVQQLVTRDQAVLDNIDQMVVVVKSATQKHKSALAAAATIEDETARNEAVQAANEEFRTTLKAAIDANADLKAIMPLGGPMMGGGHGGRGHHGPKPEMLAEKLGMTAEELNAELQSGKTIQQIAEEKGIELPERPMMFRMDVDELQSSSAQ